MRSEHYTRKGRDKPWKAKEVDPDPVVYGMDFKFQDYITVSPKKLKKKNDR